MHRFWVFPFVVGIVAAIFPAFTAAQGWIAFAFCVDNRNPFEAWRAWVEVDGAVEFAVAWFVALRAGMGLVAAAAEMARFWRSDRNGIQATRRLFGNVLWIGIYALAVNFSITLVLTGLTRVGFSGSPGSSSYLPGVLGISFLFVNSVAIFWAIIRTTTVDDVLSPRALGGKLRGSTRLIE